MPAAQDAGAPLHESFRTEDDEIGLATSQARQSGESVPDTLEVHSDTLSVMTDEMSAWRKPVRLALVAVAVGLAVIVVGGLVARGARAEAATPAA